LMDASAVAEQVVNALCSPETIRRIAITPNYSDAIAQGSARELPGELTQGQSAVETIRGAARS